MSKKENEKKNPSRPFYSHPAATQETTFFLGWPQVCLGLSTKPMCTPITLQVCEQWLFLRPLSYADLNNI